MEPKMLTLNKSVEKKFKALFSEDFSSVSINVGMETELTILFRHGLYEITLKTLNELAKVTGSDQIEFNVNTVPSIHATGGFEGIETTITVANPHPWCALETKHILAVGSVFTLLPAAGPAGFLEPPGTKGICLSPNRAMCPAPPEGQLPGSLRDFDQSDIDKGYARVVGYDPDLLPD